MPRGERWSEPLVVKLIERHHGARPEEILERHANELLREAEQEELPVDVDLIASVLGIRSRVTDLPYAGRIYAEPTGQLVMDLNAGDSNPRRRFTQAHELMHTRFPGFKREARYRADSTPGANPRNSEEEFLCDVGAAALLMPRQLLAPYDVKDGFTAVESLAGDAQVSLEAAGNRLISLADHAAAFLVLSVTNKPADTPAIRRGEDVPPRLRLRYATTAHLDAYLPRYKAADEESVLCRAWETRTSKHARELLPGVPKAGLFDVQAKAYGTHEQRRVLAIAIPAS